MALAKCVFCGCEQDDFMGTYLVRNDGGMIYYCSSKCRKNHLKLGRDKRRMKWTEAFKESQIKRLAAEKKAHDKIAHEKAQHTEGKSEKHEDKKEHAHKGEKKK